MGVGEDYLFRGLSEVFLQKTCIPLLQVLSAEALRIMRGPDDTD